MCRQRAQGASDEDVPLSALGRDVSGEDAALSASEQAREKVSHWTVSDDDVRRGLVKIVVSISPKAF